MTTGSGKYDDVCTTVRERTGARCVVIMVVDGDKGNGFSVQCEEAWLKYLPDILQDMAERIRAGQGND